MWVKLLEKYLQLEFNFKDAVQRLLVKNTKEKQEKKYENEK